MRDLALGLGVLVAGLAGLAGWLAIGSGRGRRLFAHVLGNIDSLVPREASQEVEFVSKPVCA